MMLGLSNDCAIFLQVDEPDEYVLKLFLYSFS